MRERPHPRGPAVVVVAMLAVSACSGGDDGAGEPTGDRTGAEQRATSPTSTSAPTTTARAESPTTEAPTEAAPATGSPEPGPEPVGSVAVSAGHPEAVQAGMTVLADGGTAVDAAVSAAFVMSVVEPFASGVGGGGATLVQELGERPRAYEYTEVVAQDGVLPPSDTGIPGFVAGMDRLHAEHGELPWRRLVNPATTLARDGVPTTEILADQLRSGADRLPAGDLEQFFPGGVPLSTGEPLVQPELADTLRTLAREGGPAFYGDALGGELTKVAGIDAGSLAAYEVALSRPPAGPVGPYRVHGAPLPLTGVTLVQMLQIATALGAAEVEPGSARFADAVTTGWRHGDEGLRSEVGDPGFVDVPVARLTDPERNATLVGGTPLPEPAGSGTGAGNTTHISVVDAEGTAVAMTNTILNFWGSGQEVGGFFLNDRLRRFEISEASGVPQPGQRAPSYMSPTIVTDGQERPVLVIGTPGGSRIPNVLTEVILRWGFGGQLQQAVDAPRFHYQDGVLYTEPLPDGVAGELSALGYQVSEQPPWDYFFGSVQALEVDYEKGVVRGAEDSRRSGTFQVAEGESGS